MPPPRPSNRLSRQWGNARRITKCGGNDLAENARRAAIDLAHVEVGRRVGWNIPHHPGQPDPVVVTPARRGDSVNLGALERDNGIEHGETDGPEGPPLLGPTLNALRDHGDLPNGAATDNVERLLVGAGK